VTFALRKWYLDCVAEDGALAIVYCAELRWRSLALRYASLLQFDDARGATVRSTLRGCPEPRADGRKLFLDAPALDLSGRWEALDPPASTTLLAGVQWDCVQPRSQVELNLPQGVLRGLGYAEMLTLRVAPWSLPIDELRWGRFAAKEHGAVWIEWRGPHPVRVVLIDGAASDGKITERAISVPGAPLRIEPGRVLRSGRIGETALSIIPDLASIFPGRIVGLEETKWRSAATMELQQARHDGFAIHEVVRWPK